MLAYDYVWIHVCFLYDWCVNPGRYSIDVLHVGCVRYTRGYLRRLTWEVHDVSLSRMLPFTGSFDKLHVCRSGMNMSKMRLHIGTNARALSFC
jgi:hypothetical protein